MKKFSILTINLNNREGLKKTIESIVNQTFKDFEFIVIDGGSTDGSVDIIKAYSAKIDYWVSEPDKGIYNAMNKGILKATGEYCNFMNSGDCFHQKDVLEKVYPECQEDIVVGKVFMEGYGIWGHPYPTITMIDLINGLPHQAIFVKTSILIDNPYDENLCIFSDWKFLLELLILKNSTFRSIDVIVANYENGGISKTNIELCIIEKDKVLRDFLPERIYLDYKKLEKVGRSPFLEFIPILLRTSGFQIFIYNLVSFMIKIYGSFHPSQTLRNRNKKK